MIYLYAFTKTEIIELFAIGVLVGALVTLVLLWIDKSITKRQEKRLGGD